MKASSIRGLFGWLDWAADNAQAADAAHSMGTSLSPSMSAMPSVLHQPHAAVGVTGHDAAHVYQADGVMVALCGRPYWQDDELRRLAADAGVARSLHAGFMSHGIDVLRLLSGCFSLAVVSHTRHEAYLATDRMGSLPVFHAVSGTALAFASTVDGLGAHPAAKKTPDPQQLFNYGYFHMVPTPGAIYRHFRRVGPGEYVHFKRGAATVAAYWRPVFREHERRPRPILKDEFRAILRRSVERAVGDAPTGTFLSGGTDSSTITGILAQVTGPGVRTYSIGFEAEGYDEMDYARIAAAHFGTDHHEYYVTPDDVVKAIPLIAQAYDQPYGNSSAVPTYYCSRMARADGVDVLLGGDGGDELFGGNARYAKQRVFALYDAVPRALRRGLIEPAVSAMPGGVAKLPPFNKLHSYVTQAAVPMPRRMESYNLLHRLGIAALFDADFLEGVDTEAPLRLLDSIYWKAEAETMLNRMLALDFHVTLTDNDLPKVIKMAELAGVEARFPMLDDELVEFSLALEPRLKLKGTRLRYFFKEALRDFLPAAIITKTKHGFGLPFGPWLRTHRPLQELVFDTLQHLKRRHIFRADFIDKCIDTYLHSHPSYYGSILWVMMMLELWFQYHVDAPATARAAADVTAGDTQR